MLAVEVAVDAVGPTIIGQQFWRLIDENDLAEIPAAMFLNVLPESQGAHRVTDDDQFIEGVVVDQVAQISRHSLNSRHRLLGKAVATVPTSIPAVYLVMCGQLLKEGVPFPVAGGPPVEHEDWRALTGHLHVDLYAIISKEVRHRIGLAEKGGRVSQACNDGNHYCHLE